MPKLLTSPWTLCGAIIMFCTLLLFSPWFVSRKILAPFDILEQLLAPWRTVDEQISVHNHYVTDAVTQYIPYRMFAARSFAEDGYVGWNPLVFGGVAQSANTMALSGDWSTQLYRFFDLWTAWHLGLIGQFLIAGFGMLVFLKSRDCPPAVAVFISMAYALNSQFVAWIYHQWALASFCWAPWLLWALYLAWDRSFRYTAGAALFLALALAGGTLQHAAYLVLLLACVWFGWLWGDKRDGKSWVRATMMVVAAGALGGGLAACILEPMVAAYFQNIASDHLRGGLGYSGGFVQPLLNAAAIPFYAVSSLMGSPQSLDLWKVFRSDMFNMATFGSIPVVLAVVGAFSKKVPLAAKLLMATGLLIPLSPLVGPLYHRVQLLWILGGCWAAAIWLAQSDDKQRDGFVRWCWRVLFAALAAWFVASLILIGCRSDLETMLSAKLQTILAASQFGSLPGWLNGKVADLIDLLCVWSPWQAVSVAGVVLSLWAVGEIRRKPVLSGCIGAAGVFLQLSVFWWQWTTWSTDGNPYQQPQLVRILQAEVDNGGRLAQWPRKPVETILPPNTLVPSGVPITGGYESIHPDGMKPLADFPWELPGTTHCLVRAEEAKPAGWEQIWSGEGSLLLRNPDAKTGMLIMQSGLPVPLRTQDLKWSSPNTLKVSLPTGAAGVEVYSNWHRGWKWRENAEDRWKPTVAAANKCIKVQLDPPSSHRVAIFLQFDPSPPDWVLAVTGLSVLILFAVALSGDQKERFGG